ncbi:MAG: hypothetical protein FWF88_10960 [Peptococcaceae bacterium]|nr:hypothetical protein [Peptococcaceae bacterium]
MEIRNAYKKAVDKHELPEDLVNRTREAMEDQALGKPPIKSRYGVRKVRPAFVVAVICALMLALTGTAVALLGPDFVKPYVDSVFSDVPDNSYTPVGIFTSGNLKFEVVGIARDNYQIRLRIDIVTLDGTPIQTSEPFLWSGDPVFKSIELSTSTDEVFNFNGYFDDRCQGARLDDRSRPDFASLEFAYQFHNWGGQEAALRIETLMEDLLSWEDAGCSHTNLGELCEGVVMENPDNFIIGPEGSYELPPGSLRIFFSDQFPNSYIDNMGFYKSDGAFEFETFNISIVPGNDQEAEALMSLSLMDLETQKPWDTLVEKPYWGPLITEEIKHSIRFYDDGRFHLFLRKANANFIHSAQDEYFTPDDLSRYTFIKNVQYSYSVRCEGVWELPVILQNNAGRTFAMNRVIPTSEEAVRIKSGEVTSFGVYLYCEFDYRDTGSPYFAGQSLPESLDVIMDDGSVIRDVIMRGTIGGYGGNVSLHNDSSKYPFSYLYNFDTLIDPSRAIAIDFLGERIPLE